MIFTISKGVSFFAGLKTIDESAAAVDWLLFSLIKSIEPPFLPLAKSTFIETLGFWLLCVELFSNFKVVELSSTDLKILNITLKI